MTDTPTLSRVPFIGEVIAYTDTHQLACAAGMIGPDTIILFPPASARPGLALRLMLKMTDVGKQVVVDAVLAKETFEGNRYAWEVQFVQMSPPVAEFFARYVAGRLAPTMEVTLPDQPARTGPVRATPTGPIPLQTGPIQPTTGPLRRTPTGPLPRTPTGPVKRAVTGPGFHASTGPADDLLTTQRGVGAVGRPGKKAPEDDILPDIHLDDDDLEDVPEEGARQGGKRPRDMDSDELNRYMRSGKLSQLFKDALQDLDRPVDKKR